MQATITILEAGNRNCPPGPTCHSLWARQAMDCLAGVSGRWRHRGDVVPDEMAWIRTDSMLRPSERDRAVNELIELIRCADDGVRARLRVEDARFQMILRSMISPAQWHRIRPYLGRAAA